MIVPPVYNDANFREQFPAFTNPAQYPAAALEFAWDMGETWLSQWPASWGISRPKRLQQAADLMGAVIVYQLYGPVGGTGWTADSQIPADSSSTSDAPSGQTPSQDGEAPGAVESATEGSVTASFQLPAIGTSAFSSMLLASPPYGRLLLALLQVAQSVSPYIHSHRFSRVPP